MSLVPQLTLKLIIALLMDPVLIFMGDAFDPIRSGVLIKMGEGGG